MGCKQMRVLKALAQNWFPPILASWFRQMRGGGIRFEGDFGAWDEANSRCSGYDTKDILAKVLAATLKVKHGTAAFERDSITFEKIEYVWPVVSGLMWAAARNEGKLSVLDFGGALGSSYFQNRSFLKKINGVRWNVVEQSHYVDIGCKYIEDDQLRFYKSIEECLIECQPNVILMSSVLEYLENPTDILNKLLSYPVDILIIDRSPFVASDKDKITRQIVSSSIFEATLPCRLLSLPQLELLFHEKGMIRLAKFPSIGGANDNWEYQGFIYSRR